MTSVDRKGRPVSGLTSRQRAEMLSGLLGVWEAHPSWGLGQLVAKCATAGAGCREAVDGVRDSVIADGIAAMRPDDWELELGDHPALPASLAGCVAGCRGVV